MYSRLLKKPLESNRSFFLFGARGTGKTTWLKQNLKDFMFFDLLHSETFLYLSANPSRLEELIGKNKKKWIIIDEVQKIPAILDEVQRLIESRGFKFILTGSSARKLKRENANLLAGRAHLYNFYPLTASELKEDFDLAFSLQWGHLPELYAKNADKKEYLKSYIETYLREEVLQEGLTRNLGSFMRFLEAASFSQASVLNASEVAREARVNRKVVEGYFDLLEDLLIAYRIPVFARRAKRKLVTHPKFFFFDVGIFRMLRPTGPLDSASEIDGPALETLVLQELIAINSYLRLDYEIFYWRTANAAEVDFVLYGPRGLIAIEIKRSATIHNKDLNGLKAFAKDYPQAKLYVFYGGKLKQTIGEVEILPVELALKTLSELL